MNAIVEIIGKQHIAGVSQKTGKPYDFVDIYYLGRKKGVEGLVAVKKTVGAEIITSGDIMVGCMYNLESDDDGNILGMTKANKIPGSPSAGQQNKM